MTTQKTLDEFPHYVFYSDSTITGYGKQMSTHGRQGKDTYYSIRQGETTHYLSLLSFIPQLFLGEPKEPSFINWALGEDLDKLKWIAINNESTIAKPIEEAPDYLITNTGRIYRPVKGNQYVEHKAPLNKSGYPDTILSVNGAQVSRTVHRLVALAFLGKPESPDLQVDHIDCTPTNNHISNLRWVTAAENMANRSATKHLVKADVLTDILAMRLDNKSCSEIADKHGTMVSTVWGICEGRSQWIKTVDKLLGAGYWKTWRAKFDARDPILVLETTKTSLEDILTSSDGPVILGRKYNVSSNVIRNIRKRSPKWDPILIGFDL